MKNPENYKRTYGRKIKELATLLHNSVIANNVEEGSEIFKLLIKQFERKWRAYCNQNRHKPTPPNPDAFIKYLELCQ